MTIDATKDGYAWTKQEQELVRELARSGLSASQIAREVNRTRSAICGWCSRNGVPLDSHKSLRSRKSSVEPSLAGDKKARPPSGNLQAFLNYAPPGDAYIPNPPAARGLDLTLEELEPNDCRYVYGELEDKRFCGQPAAPGKPYCRSCCQKVYRPPTDKEQRQLSSVRRMIRR